MRIIHKQGFHDAERRAWKKIIFQNLEDAFLDIFELMEMLEGRQVMEIVDHVNVVRLHDMLS
jgi:hypothetical protein